jgi:hypothetical protein
MAASTAGFWLRAAHFWSRTSLAIAKLSPLICCWRDSFQSWRA